MHICHHDTAVLYPDIRKVLVRDYDNGCVCPREHAGRAAETASGHINQLLAVTHDDQFPGSDRAPGCGRETGHDDHVQLLHGDWLSGIAADTPSFQKYIQHILVHNYTSMTGCHKIVPDLPVSNMYLPPDPYGLQFLQGLYPFSVSSSRVPQKPCLFFSRILSTDSQSGR